jgi:MFS family permease
VRSFVIGCTGVSLGLYVVAAGFGPSRLGLLVAAGLMGNALATALVAVRGDRLGRRRSLLAADALGVAGLAGLALLPGFGLAAAAAFLGMVNGMGRDRGAQLTLEQALLADLAAPARRTALFARYSLVQDVGGALGALAAALPPATAPGYRVLFASLAALSLAQAGLHAAVPALARTPLSGASASGLGPESRRRVVSLSGLFALDSLGGGLLAGSILSYWFFRRFDLAPGVVGAVFFAARLLNAASYFGAEWLARRIGLVRTMVYTHLPTSVMLAALPFIRSAPIAVGLFLLREALVQMDVPARQSYVAAVVEPHERTRALGLTNLARYAGWASGPALAGAAMATLGLGAPLVLGAALKAAYDLALFASFRSVRPPEEAPAPTAPSPRRSPSA